MSRPQSTPQGNGEEDGSEATRGSLWEVFHWLQALYAQLEEVLAQIGESKDFHFEMSVKYGKAKQLCPTTTYLPNKISPINTRDIQIPIPHNNATPGTTEAAPNNSPAPPEQLYLRLTLQPVIIMNKESSARILVYHKLMDNCVRLKREESPDEEKSAHSHSTVNDTHRASATSAASNQKHRGNLSDEDGPRSDLDLGDFPSRDSKRHTHMRATTTACQKSYRELYSVTIEYFKTLWRQHGDSIDGR